MRGPSFIIQQLVVPWVLKGARRAGRQGVPIVPYLLVEPGDGVSPDPEKPLAYAQGDILHVSQSMKRSFGCICRVLASVTLVFSGHSSAALHWHWELQREMDVRD